MSEYNLYRSWSTEEAHIVGKQFKAVCNSNWEYEGKLTEGKEYMITIEERILRLSPLCSCIGDNGNTIVSHLTRFTKIMEVKSA